MGKFISSDPIGIDGGLNTFLYAEESPVMLSDPEGLNPVALAMAYCRLNPSACAAAVGATASAVQNLQQTLGILMQSSDGTVRPVSQEAGMCTAVADLEPPGNCTPQEHRDLQNRVENACGSAIACRGGDDVATLNRKIGAHSACIEARKRINNKCFGGGDERHQNPIKDRMNAIRNCQNLLSNMGG